MDETVQAIKYTLTIGSVYALVAVGYSLIFSTTRIVNFAQGTLVVVGGYLGWWMYARVFDGSVPILVVLLLVLVGDRARRALVRLRRDRAARPVRSRDEHRLARHDVRGRDRRPGDRVEEDQRHRPDAAGSRAVGLRLARARSSPTSRSARATSCSCSSRSRWSSRSSCSSRAPARVARSAPSHRTARPRR